MTKLLRLAIVTMVLMLALFAFVERTGNVHAEHLTNSVKPFTAPLSVYTNPGDRSLYALDPLSGTRRWTFTATGYLIQTPTADVGGKVIYVGSTDGKMYAINKLSGKALWTAIVKGSVVTKVTLGQNGNIYFGTETGSGQHAQDYLYALKTSTGALVWSHNFGSNTLDQSDPFQISNNVIYIAAGSLRAVNATNGRVIWTQNAYGGNPTLGNGVLYEIYAPGLYSNTICALSPSDGSQIWCNQVSPTIDFFVTPYYQNGVLYLTGASDDKVYALSASDGSQIWSYQAAATTYYRPRPSGGQLYFTDTTAVYALNISNGSLIWKFTPPASENYPVGQPAVSGNFVYFNGSTFNSPNQNYTAALNINTGSQAWVFTLTDTGIIAPEASPIVS